MIMMHTPIRRKKKRLINVELTKHDHAAAYSTAIKKLEHWLRKRVGRWHRRSGRGSRIGVVDLRFRGTLTDERLDVRIRKTRESLDPGERHMERAHVAIIHRHRDSEVDELTLGFEEARELGSLLLKAGSVGRESQISRRKRPDR